MIIYLIGVVLSFIIGSYRLHKERCGISEYFFLFILSTLSWITIIALLLGALVKTKNIVKANGMKGNACEDLRLKSKE